MTHMTNVLIFPNFSETAKDAVCFSNHRLALFITVAILRYLAAQLHDGQLTETSELN